MAAFSTRSMGLLTPPGRPLFQASAAACLVSQEQEVVALADEGGVVNIWSANAGMRISEDSMPRTINMSDSEFATALAVEEFRSGDEISMAAGGSSGSIWIFNSPMSLGRDGVEEFKTEHSTPIDYVSWMDVNTLIAVSKSNGGSTYLVDVRSNRKSRTLNSICALASASDSVSCISLNANTSSFPRLYSVDNLEPSFVKSWDLRNPTAYANRACFNELSISCISHGFENDNVYLALESEYNTIVQAVDVDLGLLSDVTPHVYNGYHLNGPSHMIVLQERNYYNDFIIPVFYESSNIEVFYCSDTCSELLLCSEETNLNPYLRVIGVGKFPGVEHSEVRVIQVGKDHNVVYTSVFPTDFSAEYMNWTEGLKDTCSSQMCNDGFKQELGLSWSLTYTVDELLKDLEGMKVLVAFREKKLKTFIQKWESNIANANSEESGFIDLLTDLKCEDADVIYDCLRYVFTNRRYFPMCSSPIYLKSIIGLLKQFLSDDGDNKSFIMEDHIQLLKIIIDDMMTTNSFETSEENLILMLSQLIDTAIHLLPEESSLQSGLKTLKEHVSVK